MMKQQDIFKKIGNILAELNEQYQFLSQNPTQLNELEVELFLANAHFLKDHVEIVKKLNALNPEIKSEPKNAENHISEDMAFIKQVEPVEEVEMVQDVKLETIARAEEEEERIDIKPVQEIIDDEEIREETAERVVEYDFFKPDNDDHTFEFDLGKSLKSTSETFDFEEKPVAEIFDRKLSREEEEILEKKKHAFQQNATTDIITEKSDVFVEDEIGPEPFLIETEEPEAVKKVEKITEEAVDYDTKYDDAVISPPVIHQPPAFVPSAVPVKPDVAERPLSASPSFNDLLAKSNAQKNEVKLPIGDLKQAINMNERLLFIKDLFNGYNLAYSEAIDLVNKMPNFDSADSFLKSNYAVKNNWASKQATVDQFYELLNRRFS